MGISDIRTVSVYAFKLTDEGPRYLALLRAPNIDRLSGTWQAVHGSVERGESALQAAVRELKEEAGVQPIRFWQLDFVETFYVPNTDCIELVPCFGALVEDPVTICNEHERHQWMTLEEIQSAFVWRNQRIAVQQLHDGIAIPLVNNQPLNPCTEIELG